MGSSRVKTIGNVIWLLRNSLAGKRKVTDKEGVKFSTRAPLHKVEKKMVWELCRLTVFCGKET